MVLVVTLLSHGCPTQAIVAAFGLDERTVARWLASAGQHCQRVRACAVTPAILVCVDVLANCVTAFLKVFRQPVRTGRRSRRRPRPRSSTPPTTSAGPTTACASSLPTTRPASDSFAPQPWRPGSPTIPRWFPPRRRGRPPKRLLL